MKRVILYSSFPNRTVKGFLGSWISKEGRILKKSGEGGGYNYFHEIGLVICMNYIVYHNRFIYINIFETLVDHSKVIVASCIDLHSFCLNVSDDKIFNDRS